MEENGVDHNVAMERSNVLFVGNCNGAGQLETNDQVFQVRYEHSVFLDAFFTFSPITLQCDFSYFVICSLYTNTLFPLD